MQLVKHAKVATCAAVLLSACTTNTADGSSNTEPADFESYLTDSCPENVPFIIPQKISLSVSKVDWGDKAEEKLAPFKPVAVYRLTSDNKRFGGLSGLDFLDEDTLISVGDQGEMIWLDIDGYVPSSKASIAMLRGADGQPLQGKANSDAEGVAWNGTHAFVSFERNHRILGYDITPCGPNARGIEVASFPADLGLGTKIGENGGLEGLTNMGDALITGFETKFNSDARMGLVSAGNATQFDILVELPGLTQLVGLEYIGNEDGTGRLYILTRFYDPIRGNRNAILVHDVSAEGDLSSEARASMTFDASLTIDNYEGIAVQKIDAATDRVFLISDNNFSDRQRTLLAVLEYQHGE